MISFRFGRLVGTALVAALALVPVAASAQSAPTGLQPLNVDRTKGPLDSLPTVLGKIYSNEKYIETLIGNRLSPLGTAALLNVGTVVGTVADGGALSTEILRAKDAEATKVGRLSSFTLTGAPASVGNWGSIDTAFAGDLSKMSLALKQKVTGSATAGNPTTGYVLTRELAAAAQYLDVSSEVGTNASASTNDGRTGVAMNVGTVFHRGNGDAYLNWFSLLAAGARAGATHFLANPAVTALGGVIGAAHDGVLLQGIGDLNFNDNGYDAAVVGMNMNLNRSNNTGALSADWIAYRAQSIGSKAIGAAFSAVGKMRVGLDFTHADFDVDKLAIALPAGARIYGNAYNTDTNSLPRYTMPATDWIERSSSGFWGIAYNNLTALQINDVQITSLPVLNALGGIREPSNPPPNSQTGCTPGDRTWDQDWEYRCVSANHWKRAPLSDF